MNRELLNQIEKGERIFCYGTVHGGQHNKSTIGNWAYRRVTTGHRLADEATGAILPFKNGCVRAHREFMKMYAVIVGLECAPKGWSGTVWIDSEHIHVELQTGEFTEVTAPLKARFDKIMASCGDVSFRRLANMARETPYLQGYTDLADGSDRAIPVSVHGAWVRNICRNANRVKEAA